MEETTAVILDSEIERIKKIAPFRELSAATLAAVLAESPLAFYKHGQVVCHAELSEPMQGLWLVRQGAVLRSAAPTGASAMLPALPPQPLLEAGALFPLDCALETRRPTDNYTAHDDTFLWRIEGATLEKLLAKAAFARWLAACWQAQAEQLRAAALNLARSRQVTDQALALPARSAGSTTLAYTAPQTPIGQVAALLAERKIGSLLVGTPDRVDGIVTQSDLVRRALAARLPYDTAVSSVMTPAPAAIDDSASVLEAGIEMAQRGFRHLLIRDSEGTVSGIVSERDLFRVQQQGIVHIFQPISEAGTVGQLVAVAGRIRELTERVFRQGMEVSQFMRLVSSINDRITQRLLTLIAGDRFAGRQFCWLAFGSEGREEQGFVTDQDNGICFVPRPGVGVEAERADHLALGREMNEALHAAGFERCKGNIMAGNPEWCLSLDEWKAKFSRWMASTTPTALLNATIFFDFRPIHGEHALAEDLRDHLLNSARANTLFLSMLAKNALEVSPPVGRISRFNTARGEHQGTIDLKTQGSRLFVDIARIYALAHGVRSSNTEQRLRLGGQRAKRAPAAIEGDVAALRFIQKVRLQRQLDSLGDHGDANRIAPYLINEVEQRVLRESFHQAQSLQDRLRLDYQR